MDHGVSFEEVLSLVKRLTPRDQARLIKELAPELERALEAQPESQPKSLRGLWKGLDISEEELASMRRELWGQFPRSDI